MDKHTYFIVLGAILIVLVPIVPKMVQVRIAVLRWLKLTWFADFHEKYLEGIVLAVRIILVAMGIFLITLGVTG